MIRARALPGLLAAALACAPLEGPPSDRPPPASLHGLVSTPGVPAMVLLISVSGLTPDRLRADGQRGPAMPTVAALAGGGVDADRVVPVVPATRWPSHTSLVSGRRPSLHGIPADRLIGERGVRSAFYTHASQVKGATLWSSAAEAGLRVAAIGWPASVGAAIEFLIPDIPAPRRGKSWLDELADTSTPWLFDLARRRGGSEPATAGPGPARDSTLARVACDVVESAVPPRLLLLHLSQTAPPLVREGPHSEAARAAFASADVEIERLLRCLDGARRSSTSAVLVMGDHGWLPAHTELRPNAVLENAGLLQRDGGGGLRGWRALSRSNGGSAFVYAKSEGDALRARRALAEEAKRSGEFRVISADEMLRLGADPEAWFGLAARPGYLFGDAATSPLRRASTRRGAGGYLPDEGGTGPAFVLRGRGVRAAVRVPWMRQIDVAPTMARLLGIELAGAEGVPVVGVLDLSAPRIAPATEGRREP